MPIYYYKSLSLDQLAEQLSHNINSKFKDSKNPLYSSIVVIPNTNIRTWLQLKIAKIQGISLNLTFEFFENLITRYFFEKKGTQKDKSVFESKLSSQNKILSYLIKEKESKQLSQFSKYLNNISRAFSLSSKIRSLFDEYEFNRPNWITQWSEDLGRKDLIPVVKSNLQSIESSNISEFQIKLYKDVFLNKKNEKIRTNQFLLKKENRNDAKKDDFTFPSIHIFCLSNLSELYVQILEEISIKDEIEIFFYQFFTDLPKIEQENLKSSPLRWAKSQKYLAEKIESISERSKFSTSLLSNQTEIIDNRLILLQEFLHAKISKEELHLKINDIQLEDGIRFWNASSIFREVEAVAHDILNKVQNCHEPNKKLSYLDFSILVTDINLYRPAIEWVFDGGILLQESKDSTPTRYKIPYSLTDLKGIDNSFLFRGLLDIFKICENDQIKQDDVITLISNPIFGFINQDSSLDENDIKDILLNLGAYYEEEGRESDLFQISKSIQKLRMSTVFDFDLLNQKLDMGTNTRYSDNEIQFISLIWNKILNTKKIIRQSLKESNFTKSSLQNIFFALDDIFNFEDEFEREASNFQEWYESVLEWESFEFNDFIEGIEMLKLLTNSIFDKMPYRHGSFLIEGVSVSLLQPMRPIPFEHVYILGLGEGKFPGKIDHSNLDLRKQVPEPWDSNKIEIQESLLWEALHSALSSITLSYIGEDTKEQKSFNPCSHYYELMTAFSVDEPYKIPLHSYSNKYLDSTNLKYKSYDFTLRLLHDNKLNLDQFLPKFETENHDQISNQIQTKPTIDIIDLSKYMIDPLDSYLKKQLGMYLDDTKIDTDGYEIFTLGALEDSALFKKIYPLMIEDLVKSEDWSWDYEKINLTIDAIILEEQRNSRFPQSIYSELQKKSMLEYLSIASEIFRSWKPNLQGGEYFHTLSIGDTGIRSSKDHLLKCRKLNTLEIPTSFNSSIKLSGEWNNIILKDNKIFWLNIGTLAFDLKDGDGKFIKNNARSFLSALALNSLNEKLIIYSMKSRPKDVNKDTMKIDFSILLESKNDSLNSMEYLTQIANQYINKDPILFLTKSFEEYYLEKSKLTPAPQPEEIFQDDQSWKQYLIDNSEDAVKELSETSRLYPNVMDFILESNSLHFAKTFFYPLLQYWKPVR